jgi:hypothetical protein
MVSILINLILPLFCQFIASANMQISQFRGHVMLRFWAMVAHGLIYLCHVDIAPILAMGTTWFLKLIQLCYHRIVPAVLANFSWMTIFQVDVLFELQPPLLLVIWLYYFQSYIVMQSTCAFPFKRRC